MLEADLVSPDDFVTAQYPLTQVVAAFADASSGRQVKVVLLADSPPRTQ
jgi:Zn-dependent alcohol dehydrogenase